MKHELRSPDRCIRRDVGGQTGNTTSRKSLPKVTLNKCLQLGTGKQGDMRTRESKPAQKQHPSYNRKHTSASNRGGKGVEDTEVCLSVINEASIGTISKPSTNVAVSPKSKNLDGLNAFIGCPPLHERDALQTISLPTNNISANNRELPQPCSFCQVSASDTVIVVPRHPCMTWCPYAQPHMSVIGKNLNTVINFRTQPNGSCQSCQKYTNPHAKQDCGEIIICSAQDMCLSKRLETSPLMLQENSFTHNLTDDIWAAASAGLGSQSSVGSTTHISRWMSVPHVREDEVLAAQIHNCLLAGTCPSTISAKLEQGQLLNASSNTVLQESSSVSGNPLQQASIHSNIQPQAYTSFPWNILEELCAEQETDFSLPNDDNYFVEMVDLIVRILFAMYIKESNNRCIKKPTTETCGNKISDDPCIETLKSNFKKKCKEKTSSSLLDERWNPEQCVKDTKPLLQVKYNAPVRPSSRPASRDEKCEVRAKSEPPRNVEVPVLRKSLKYGKRKVFVQLTGEAVSPKRAEKQKDLPFVSSRSPRKRSLIAQRDKKVLLEDKIIQNGQKHVMNTKEVILNIEQNESAKHETLTMPTSKHNKATVKKIKFGSPNRWANQNMYAVRKGVLCGNGEPNVDSTRYTPEGCLTFKGSKDKRCQTWLAHQPLKSTAGDSGLTETSQSRNIKPQDAVFTHNFVNFKNDRSGQLTTRQQAFPKKSYGMVNLLVDSQIASDDMRYATFPAKKTCVDERADSMSAKKAAPNTGTPERVGAKEDFVTTKSTKSSRHRKLHYDIEYTKVSERTDERPNHQNSRDVRDKSAILRSARNATRKYLRVCEEDNVCIKNYLEFCPQSWPADSSYHVARNRNESENHYCYNKRSTNGEFDKQDKSRKQMKCKGSKLKDDCSDSGDCQGSKHKKVIDLSLGNYIPNRQENSSTTPKTGKYCRVTSAKNTDKTESGVRTGGLFKKCSTEPILTDKSHIKKNHERTYVIKESFQSGGNIQCLNLPVRTQTINNRRFDEGRQLLAPTDNLLSNSKCHNKPELIQFLGDDSSPKRSFQGLSWISPIDPKLHLREALIGKDIQCELDKAQDNMRDSRNVLIQPRINDLEHQNCLGEMKCKWSHACDIRKRRNPSRRHALYHADKEFKKSNRAMISSRTINDTAQRLQTSPRNAHHGLNDKNCQEMLTKSYKLRTKAPCCHTTPCCIEKLVDPLPEGEEQRLAAKHCRYQQTGGVLPGSVTRSAGCYIRSALHQACAENIGKNKSGISPTDISFNTVNLCREQPRTNRPHLEENSCLSWGFDKSDVSGNGSRVSSMYSDFGQSENIKIDNLIMSKDAKIRKSNSDSIYVNDVYHTLSTAVKHAYISVAKETSHKEHQDNRIIGKKFNSDNQGSFVNPNIPRDNLNYYGHPYTLMERSTWAHHWNSLPASNVQAEPLDLSRKERQTSHPAVAHPGRERDKVLQDVAPTATFHPLFPLQSSPLNLSTK